MTALSKTSLSVLPVTDIKAMPIVAALFDCLLVSAGIFYFTSVFRHHSVAASPKPITAVAEQLPSDAGTAPQVLGESTTTPKVATPPIEPKSTATALLAQSADPTPFPSTPAVTAPTPSPAVAVAPPTDSTPTPAAPTATDSTSTPITAPDPTPVQADFTTIITQAGQVAPGTLISLNNAKGEKAYYGGDLTLSANSVTISRSGLLPQALVTVSSPDAAIVNTPSSVDSGAVPGIGMDASLAITSGTSFTMLVGAGSAPNGTYILHISTFRTGQTADAWQYDGFITVSVVD